MVVISALGNNKRIIIGGYILGQNNNGCGMKMGCLSGRMGWVELVVMRCGSSTLR